MMAPSTSSVRDVLRDHGRLAHPPDDVQRLAHHAPKLFEIKGFEEIVVSALFHGLDGRVRHLARRDEDDRDPRVEAADLLVDVQARLVGQPEVEENDIGRPGPDSLEPGEASAGDLDPVGGGGEELPNLGRDQRRVVIDE